MIFVNARFPVFFSGKMGLDRAIWGGALAGLLFPLSIATVVFSVIGVLWNELGSLLGISPALNIKLEDS